jgi:hypothetical protein
MIMTDLSRRFLAALPAEITNGSGTLITKSGLLHITGIRFPTGRTDTIHTISMMFADLLRSQFATAPATMDSIPLGFQFADTKFAKIQ